MNVVAVSRIPPLTLLAAAATLLLGQAVAQLPFEDVSLPLQYVSTGTANALHKADLSPFNESTLLTSPLLSDTSDIAINPSDGRVLFSAPASKTNTPVIWMYVPASGALGQLTIATGEFDGEFSPVWNEDGTRFFCVRQVSDSVAIIVIRHGPGFSFETVIPATETNVHRRIYHPALSRTGKRLVYVSQEPNGTYRLYTVAPSPLGTTRTLVLNKTFIAIDHPSFSPDLSKIMYVQRDSNATNSIRTVNFNGTNDALLVSLSNRVVTGLEWSRDDALVAVSVRHTNRTLSAISVFNPDGTGLTQLASSPTLEYHGVTWGQGYPRLYIRVEDALTGDPIPGATVIARPDGHKAGFELEYFDNGGVIQRYESAPLTAGNYDVVAAAAGYTAAILDDVAALPGIPQQVTAALALNPAPDNLGRLDIQLPIFDAQGGATGTRLVPNDVTVTKLSVEIPVSVAFLDGLVRVFEVPKGNITVSIDAGDNYSVNDESFAMGFGEFRRLLMPAHRLPFARASLPGQIVGSVTNVGTDPVLPISNARVYYQDDTTGFAFYTRATIDGIYFLPDVDPGSGSLQAFTSDQSHSSAPIELDVLAGDIYGDDEDEPSDLEIAGVEYDSDGDGMDDAYEAGNGLDADNPEGDFGAEGDPDGDGAQNLQEYVIGTDPQVPDSDADGWTDGQEIAAGTDALDSGSALDPLDEIWLDFGYEERDGIGSTDRPFATVSSALTRANPGGTLVVKGDVPITTSAEAGLTLDIPLTLVASGGNIQIGSTQ